MNFIKRGYLYVIRKKGKSFLLFTILLIMATFVLTGLSIWNATNVTQKNLRQRLGGTFTIGVDWSENNPYFHTEELGNGSYIYYSDKQITPDMVQKIKQVDGVKYCDAVFESLYDFKELSLFPGNLATEKEFARLVKTFGIWRTKENRLFTSGNLLLTEGRHIEENDIGKAIICKDLAEQSNLKIGDTISTKSSKGKEIKVEIVGLFEPTKLESSTKLTLTSEKIQNLVFLDIATMITLDDEYSTLQGFSDITVTVDDPEHMKQIISNVKKIKSFDWKGFKITSDAKTYENALQPLTNLNNLIITLLVIIIIVSIIILSLILTLWAKSRVHETGVFLSLGIKKASIIGQYLVEVLLIAIFAFSLSYFSSNAIANQIGTSLLQQNMQKENHTDIGQTDEVTASSSKNNEASSVDDTNGEEDITTEITNMQITVGIDNLIQLYVVGPAIIIMSVCVSSIPVMRLKPRKILSKMS